MRERRSARVGTVSGLALLAGGTAVVAVGAPSLFATTLLGLLTVGLAHALTVEIKRQGRRDSLGWAREDTINTVLLGAWAEAALIATVLQLGSPMMRAVSPVLALAYAACCGWFVTERRRAIRSAAAEPEQTTDAAPPAPAHEPESALTEVTTH